MSATIIAEIGHNHNGNMELAKWMIWEAAECGADVAKFQFYDIETIKKPWQSRYFELWAAQMNEEDLHILKETSDEFGIEFMVSVFSPELVKIADPYVERFKVASRSIYEDRLFKEMKKTGKPIIASLGKWKHDSELPTGVDYLYCVSDYPATIDPNKFPTEFGKGDFIYSGFSDHTLGLDWAKTAIDRGASIIEKHFTLSRDLPGYNQAGSMNPTELKELVKYAR